MELTKIARAKEKGLPVTCGITPHHLFLTRDDEKRLGAYGKMKPYLKTKKDLRFIWDNFQYIDLVESDHAPHTIKEKEAEAPFGVPGLDTTLPLLLTATVEGRLTIDEIIQLCHTNPAKIFNISTSKQTLVDVEMEEYTLTKKDLKTKSGWSPFEGGKVTGKVRSVIIRGKEVYKNGILLVKKGNGKIVTPSV